MLDFAKRRKNYWSAEGIKDYLLGKTGVYERDGHLVIGKGGRGRIEVLELEKSVFGGQHKALVTIFEDSPESARETYDHIHEAVEWCLGRDALGGYRQMFDENLRVLATVPSSTQDLDQLYALACAYVEILEDDECSNVEHQMQVLRTKLRDRVQSHVSTLSKPLSNGV